MKDLFTGRRKPYTAIGIRRVPCCRCGTPSQAQWQVCANGNMRLGLCVDCDILLNELALQFIKHKNAKKLMQKYRAEKLGHRRNAALLAYERMSHG